MPTDDSRVSIWGHFIRYWHPQPLTPPQVNRELARWSAPQRIGEVIRYTWLRLEFWVSPGGGLREWARLNVALALLVGIPLLIFAPLITVLLTCFVSWTDSLVHIVTNLFLIPVIALAGFAILTALLGILRKFNK